jgi:hypothetical protein
VRWLLCFCPLPPPLEPRGEARVPGIVTPLRLFELDDALPRAFYVPRAQQAGAELEARLQAADFDPRAVVLVESPPPQPKDAPAEGASVTYEAVDAHTVRLWSRTPPGFLVVTNGFHPDWRAADGRGPVPLLRANGRYWAIPTAGGERNFTVRYSPRWRVPALAAALAGLALVILLARSSS